MAVLLSDKTDFRAKEIIRNREVHYIMVKGQSTKKTADLSVHAPNNSGKICEGKNNKTKRGNRQIHKYS